MDQTGLSLQTAAVKSTPVLTGTAGREGDHLEDHTGCGNLQGIQGSEVVLRLSQTVIHAIEPRFSRETEGDPSEHSTGIQIAAHQQKRSQQLHFGQHRPRKPPARLRRKHNFLAKFQVNTKAS